MKKLLFTAFKIVAVCYISIVVLLYLFQEKVIFIPHHLDDDHSFHFEQDFEEMTFHTEDGTALNGLLFKAPDSKGLIFYLHGNAGSLEQWGRVAGTYTDLNYDIFILDYRGYGKSKGSISSEGQVFSDNQMVYDQLLKMYDEKDITLIGYSIGSGLAAKLAADNDPNRLILQAPYYSLPDMMKSGFSFIPTFILKYKFATNEYLKDFHKDVIIFHGNRDQVISYESSLKLKADFRDQIELITLNGQQHNGITANPVYLTELSKILSN